MYAARLAWLIVSQMVAMLAFPNRSRLADLFASGRTLCPN